MPTLPRYERRVGPQRYEPQAERATGGATAQGLVQFGQGFFNLGKAIAAAQEKLEKSQAEIEVGKAANQARQRVHDFELALNEDPEFFTYEDKYKEVADSIARDIPKNIKTKIGQDKFTLWWEETNEELRFKVAKIAQKKNLEWQIKTLEESVNGIVARGDEHSVADLKSLLEGAHKNGLITTDQSISILNESRLKIHEKQATDIAVSLGLEEGREWLLSDEFPETLDVSLEKRVEIADKMYTQWSREKTVQQEQTRQQQEKENNQAFKDFINGDFMTAAEIDEAYPTLDPAQKLRWKGLHQTAQETEEKYRQEMGKSSGSILSYAETEMRAARGKGAARRLEMLRDYVDDHRNTDDDFNRGLSREDYNRLVDEIDKRIGKVKDDGEDPSDGAFRVGMREIEAGTMNEARMRELGDQLEPAGEASEKSLRALWRGYRKDAEARSRATERKSDPTAIGEIDDMLMDWRTEYRDIESRILELKAEGKLTSKDALTKRDYALKKKTPSELLEAKIAIDGIFDKIAAEKTGDAKVDAFATGANIKNTLTQEFFEGVLTEEQILPRAKQLMQPHYRTLWDNIFGKPIGPRIGARETGNALFPATEGEKDRGTLQQTGETGTELWKKGDTWYRKRPDGVWQRRDKNGKWVTDR
jgi:hypothetical protein